MDSDDEQAGAYHIDQTSTLLTSIHPVSNLAGPSRTPKDYFNIAKDLLDGRFPHAQWPYHSFSILSTPFHLTCNPTFCNLSVDEASSLFGLSDLHPALADFLRRTAHDGIDMPLPIGGCCAALPNAQLPFNSIQLWSKVWIQGQKYHLPNEVVKARTVMAAPSSTEWPLGQFDVVITNVDPDQQWPQSGLTGTLCLLG